MSEVKTPAPGILYQPFDRSQVEIKIKGSKFIADILPADRNETVLYHLATIKKEHPKAHHHCWACRIGAPVNYFRANDDGEPSGTAGKPILGQLIAASMTNTMAIVTRYFGGTLLGTGGLIKAYKEATREALASCQKLEVKSEYIHKVFFPVDLMPQVMNAVKKLPFKILEKQLQVPSYMIISSASESFEHDLNLLKAYSLGISPDHAADLPGCHIIIEKMS